MPLILVASLFVGCQDDAIVNIDPPHITIPASLSAVSGSEFVEDIMVSDPNGLPVDVSVEGLPSWLSYFPDQARLRGTPTNDDLGTTQAEITADNGTTQYSVRISIRVFSSVEERDLQNEVVRLVSVHTSGLRGVSVAVVDRNGDAYAAYTGHMGSSANYPAYERSSMFRVASVTKPMTTALILKLVDEGKISLDDILTDHYDTPLPNADIMNLRQMLSHTAGVFDHLNSQAFWGHPTFTGSKVWTVEELVQFAVTNGSRFQPGNSYGYSNTAFCVLGAVAEKYAGVDLGNAFDQMLFQPLGLEHILYDDFSTSTNTIPGIAFNNRTYEYHLTSAGAAGAMVASPTDVALFGWNLYGGRFVTKELSDQMSVNLGARVGGHNYGLGTRIWSRSGIPHHGHTGNLMDYRNILMYIPQADMSIAIHTHNPHANWNTLINQIFAYAVERFSDARVKRLPDGTFEEEIYDEKWINPVWQ